MADRYWVGGSGTWNTTSTTNWSTSSGGASGASAPTASDNVFFDSNSNVGTGAFTVTVSAAVCNDFNAPGASTALDGAMTLAMGSSTLTVSGSWTNQATNFAVTNTAGTLTFNATTTGKTITTNGVTIGVNTTLNGVGGAWTLGSALNISTFTLTLTNGTFDTSASNYAVTAGAFSSNNSNTRTINLNGSTITLSTASFVWNMQSGTNATLNAGTSTIVLTSTIPIFAGAGKTYYNVQFTATNASSLFQVIGNNTYNNFTVATAGATGLSRLIFTASQTINGTLTVNGSNGNIRLFVNSQTIGTTVTLTCAAIAATTDVDFRDITIAGAAGTLSGTRLGDCGGNSNITFVAGTNKYWNLAAGGNWNATAWATSSGGGVADTNFPLAQDTVIIENTGLTAGNTITINNQWNIGTLDSSTRTNAMTLASSTNTPTFYGNFTYGSGVTPTGTGAYTFSNRSTKTLDSGGKTFTQPVTIYAPSGGIQLVTNNLTLGTTLTTTLTSGTLDLNNLTLTTGLFDSSNSNTRTIAFGTGNISCSGTGAVWYIFTSTNLTTTGTQVVNVTSAGSTAITTTPGALSEANSISFNFTGGTYALTFLASSNHTARNVNFTGYAGTWQTTGPATIYGNLTLSTGMSLTASGSAMTFGATSGTQQITTNGKTLDFSVTFNGVGGTFKLQDAMTVGSTRTTTLTNGTLDLNNLTLTTGLFSSSNSNTRTIAFGTGNITCSGTGTVWTTSTATNLTTTGTQVVNVTSVGSTAITVNYGAMNETNAISFNFTGGTYALTLFNNVTYARNIDFTGYAGTVGAVGISCRIYGNLTLSTGMTLTASSNALSFEATSGTQQITSNGKTMDFPITFNGVGGTFRLQDAMTVGSTRLTTLTNGTLDLNNLTLTTGVFASSNSNARTIAFGTLGKITLSGNNTTVWTTSTTTNFSSTGTFLVVSNYAGATGTRGFVLGALAVDFKAGSASGGISFGTAGTDTVGVSGTAIKDLDTSSFTGTFANGTRSLTGNLTIGSGTTVASGTSVTTFAGTTGTQQITSNGKTLDFPITFDGVGGTFRLQDAMTLGSTRTMTLTNGTLNLNGNTCTVGTAFTTATGTKNLTFNGGTLVCPTASTTAFNNAQPTNFTTTAGTGTGTISMTAATAKTFVGGGSTYNCTLNQGGAGALTITGSNTFDNITNTVQPASVLFTAGTTSTFLSGFSLSGTAGNLITIGSDTAASHTLSKASGTVSVSYCSISRSSATGGAIWQSLTTNGNVDGGNNTGWIFSTGSGNFLMFF